MMRRQANVVEPMLLSITLLRTQQGDNVLTSATGFFFTDGDALFLITNRHVVCDEASGHRPDRVELAIHTDYKNLAATTSLTVPLYASGQPAWRETSDAGGLVDIVAIKLDVALMPPNYYLHAFTRQHIPDTWNTIIAGSSAVTVGFPMGFYDALHMLPVVRQSSIASAMGLRFQGQGYFLTDARTHSGSSGSPVLMYDGDGINATSDIPWMLLGVHSSRLDTGTRDMQIDEALGLNCCWYADALIDLTT